MDSERFWPLVVIAIVVFFGGLLAWSVQRAATGGSSVSDSAYYLRGLRHDREVAAEEAARDEGWVIVAEVEDGELRVRLADASGRSVTGAEIKLHLPGAAIASEASLPVNEGNGGEYALALPPRLSGTVTARLEVSRGDARVVRSLLLNP